MSAFIPPQVALVQMITGSWVSQSIYAAAKLGLADLLKDGAKSSAELAEMTGTHERSLYRLLRGLASLGIFAEDEQGRFSLTPLATYLQNDVPGSMRAMAIMMGEEHHQAWGNILHSVKTGESAFEQIYQAPVFEYLAQHPESSQIFDQAMTSFSGLESQATATGYDFSSIKTLVDVGGGHGSLLTTILDAHPHLHGILFDQAPAIASAQPLIEQSGLGDRCELKAGDFFASVPAGGDAYILKHIIHDWDDQRAIKILQNCRAAMPATGRVLLVEQVIPPGNDPFAGKLLDLNMLVMCPGGCERTESEYQTLLAAAGFKLTRIVPTQSDVSVVEGVPA